MGNWILTWVIPLCCRIVPYPFTTPTVFLIELHDLAVEFTSTSIPYFQMHQVAGRDLNPVSSSTPNDKKQYESMQDIPY
jgi:hypothetical protein